MEKKERVTIGNPEIRNAYKITKWMLNNIGRVEVKLPLVLNII